MLKRRTRILVLLHLSLDLIVTLGALFAAYFVRFQSGLFDVPDEQALSRYIELVPFVVVVWPLVFYFQGLYRMRRGDSRVDELFQIISSTALALLIVFGCVLYYSVYILHATEFQYSQKALVLFGVLDIGAVFVARMAFRTVLEERRRRGKNLRNVVIAGAGGLGRKVADRILDHDALGFRITGFLDDAPEKQGSSYRGIPIIGRLEDAAAICQREVVDHFYVALPLAAHENVVKLLALLSKEVVDVKVVPDLLEYVAIRAGLEDLDGIPIITLSGVGLEGWSAAAKRLMDIAACLAIAVAISPLLMVIAILIKLTSKGPALYKQERMGLDGRSFWMYKFRSMVDGAEAHTGPVWAAENDTRRTPIGSWLRKFSLDELPQLYNVLRGEMSLVGPRPERPNFVQEFKEKIPQYMLRHKVKSGMTGWAQVHGWRGNTSIDKRIEYDIYYVENWSLALDLKILWMTAFRGFVHHNAY
ncbi:MAG: undecaprenyl-phosphate glucose phosphotransferase [Acidobacteriota bacterium]